MQVASKWSPFAFAVTTENALFACGSNEYGQLATGLYLLLCRAFYLKTNDSILKYSHLSSHTNTYNTRIEMT